MATSPKLSEQDKEKEYYSHLTSRHNTDTGHIEGEEIKGLYDRTATYYDDLLTKTEFNPSVHGSRELTKYLKEVNCPSDANIVDVGAGTGFVGEILKQTYGYTNLTAVDISPKMLEEAKKKNLYKEFILCDLNKDSLEAYYQKFDHLIAMGCFVLGNIIPAALEKVAKLVKPGGFVCISFREMNLNDEKLDYHAKIKELEAKSVWKERSRVLGSYLSLSDETVQAYYVTFQIC